MREFLARSPCPFAQRAAVLNCGPWPDTQPLDERIDALHDGLLTICEGKHDLLVLELKHAERLGTPREAAALLHFVLAGLRRRDGACSEQLTDGIESPDWDFQHGNERFFVSFFAPLYPRSHSRFSGDEETAFVLFQPESSFRRFGVSSSHPRREKLSRAVHDRFVKQGKDYDVSGNSATPKAMRFIKPVRSCEPPIAWWRVPYDAEAR